MDPRDSEKQVDELLAHVAGDAPTTQEVEQMWTAIQAAGPFSVVAVTKPSSGRRTILQFAAAVLAAAATLVIAFLLGQSRYPSVALFTKTLAESGPTTSPMLAVNGREARRLGETMAAGHGVTQKDNSPENWFFAADADGDGATDLFGVAAGGTGIVKLGEASERTRGLGRQAGDFVIAGGVTANNDKAGQEVVPSPSLPPQDASRQEVPASLNVNGVSSEKYFGEFKGVGTPANAPAGAAVRGAAPSPPPAPMDAPERFAAEGAGLANVDELSTREVAAKNWKAALGDTDLYSHIAGAVPAAGEAGKPEGKPEHNRSDLLAYGHAVQNWGTPQEKTVARVTQTVADTPPPPAPPVAQKVIKTGTLSVEVQQYEDAQAKVDQLVKEHGGFVADMTTMEQTGGARTATLIIRVAPERFDSLFAALKTVGRLEAENAKTADVTAEYVDLDARIHSLTIAEERLRDLLANKSFMDKIASLLEVERELTRVRSQIEQLEGQMRVMADRVAMSTITLTLREPVRTVPTASLSVEVAALNDAYAALGAALESQGGRLLSGQTSKREDGTLQGDYSVQIGLPAFDALLTAVQALGRVEARQIKDRQFGDAAAPWADKVKCNVALVLYERSRQLPGGSATIEVENVPAALTQLELILTNCRASITSNRTTRRDDGSSVAELSITLPAGRFADLVNALAPLGRTTAKEVSGEAGRIVGGAAEMLRGMALTLSEPVRQVPSGQMAVEVARFAAAREALSKLISAKSVQVLQSTSNQRTDGTWVGQFRLGIPVVEMEPVVAKLASLGRIDSRQITGLGLGDLARIDPKAVGVITLALFEKPTVTPPSEQAGGQLRDRLRDGLTGLYASLGLIVYGLVVMAPWLVVVLVVAWLVLRQLRKRRSAVVPAPAPAAAGAKTDSPAPGGRSSR